MGNEQSQVAGGGLRFGFQVQKSTKLEVPLHPWFDYICGINGREIDDPDPRPFQEEVNNCIGRSVTFGVWSAKGQTLRQITIPIPASEPSLGVSLKWAPLSDAENVWHILDVIPHSPAYQGGLLPYSDYIVGTPFGKLRGESGLGELVEDHIDRPLQLYVYNHEFDVTREVTILPRKNWGGDGALGCVLGFGALHRIPPPLGEPLSDASGALFDSAFEDEVGPASMGPPGTQEPLHFTTPAFDLQSQPYPAAAAPYAGATSPPPPLSTPSSPPPAPRMMDPSAIAASQTGGTNSGRQTPSFSQPPPMSSPYSQDPHIPTQTPPPRAGRNKGKAARAARSNLMDAYMQEEEDKSKREDYGVDSATGGTGSPAPPPGSGRPPPPLQKKAD